MDPRHSMTLRTRLGWGCVDKIPDQIVKYVGAKGLFARFLFLELISTLCSLKSFFLKKASNSEFRMWRLQINLLI